MKEYLILLVSASALGVVADLVCGAYGAKAKGLERVIKTAVALAILGALFTPFVRTLRSDAFWDSLRAQEIPQTVSETDAALSFLKTECEATLSEKVFEKTGIKPVSVRIDMELSEEGNVRVNAATVVLPAKDGPRTGEVRYLCEELLGTDVVVTDDETAENAS